MVILQIEFESLQKAAGACWNARRVQQMLSLFG